MLVAEGSLDGTANGHLVVDHQHAPPRTLPGGSGGSSGRGVWEYRGGLASGVGVGRRSEDYPERRADSELRRAEDLAAHRSDDLVAYRQAEPRSMADRLCREEGIEDARQHVGANPRAVILYLEDDAVLRETS